MKFSDLEQKLQKKKSITTKIRSDHHNKKGKWKEKGITSGRGSIQVRSINQRIEEKKRDWAQELQFLWGDGKGREPDLFPLIYRSKLNNKRLLNYRLIIDVNNYNYQPISQLFIEIEFSPLLLIKK